MKIIINIGEKFGTLDGVITLNSELYKIVFSKIKEGKATLIVDNENTLFYIMSE